MANKSIWFVSKMNHLEWVKNKLGQLGYESGQPIFFNMIFFFKQNMYLLLNKSYKKLFGVQCIIFRFTYVKRVQINKSIMVH